MYNKVMINANKPPRGHRSSLASNWEAAMHDKDPFQPQTRSNAKDEISPRNSNTEKTVRFATYISPDIPAKKNSEKPSYVNEEMVRNLSEKDKARLEAWQQALRGARIKYNESNLERRQKKLEDLEAQKQERIEDSHETENDAPRTNYEALKEELRQLLPEWKRAGERYILDSSRREKWNEHVTDLIEADPAGARDRVENVLILMQMLDDDKRNLADYGDRADHRTITEIAKEFRKHGMKDPFAGMDFGSVNYQAVDENGNRLYDKDGRPVAENRSHDLVVPLSEQDRGTLEDLALTSPQGLAVFRELWPERFWTEEDRKLAQEAKHLNIESYRDARRKAEQAGILPGKLQQGKDLMTRWGGKDYTEQLGKYWSRFVDLCNTESPEQVEAALEILELLNDASRDTTEALEIMEDYKLSPAKIRQTSEIMAICHPRGLQVLYALFHKNGIEPTDDEQDLMDGLREEHERIQPGVMKKLDSESYDRAQRAIENMVAIRPRDTITDDTEDPTQIAIREEIEKGIRDAEERAKAARMRTPEDKQRARAKEIHGANLRIELEARKLAESRAALEEAKARLEEFKQVKRRPRSRKARDMLNKARRDKAEKQRLKEANPNDTEAASAAKDASVRLKELEVAANIGDLVTKGFAVLKDETGRESMLVGIEEAREAERESGLEAAYWMTGEEARRELMELTEENLEAKVEYAKRSLEMARRNYAGAHNVLERLQRGGL